MLNPNEFLNPEEFDAIRDQSLKMAAALAARRIALWEYDIPADRYDLGEGYFEILGLDRAGSIVWLDDDILACQRDETGQPVRLYAPVRPM